MALLPILPGDLSKGSQPMLRHAPGPRFSPPLQKEQARKQSSKDLPGLEGQGAEPLGRRVSSTHPAPPREQLELINRLVGGILIDESIRVIVQGDGSRN